MIKIVPANPNHDVLPKIDEINNFYEVPEDLRRRSITGNLNQEEKDWWLWNRPQHHHTDFIFCNFYYSLLITTNGKLMILCTKCYNKMENVFWQKVTYHFRKSNLLLIHEHNEGHFHCDICAMEHAISILILHVIGKKLVDVVKL